MGIERIIISMSFSPQKNGLRIGMDFDNTMVIYDRVFHRYAVECFNMPADVPADKASIRSYFQGHDGGADDWIDLQGIVYGEKMSEAAPASGLEGFLVKCRERRAGVFIISHKTMYPAGSSRANLHDAAWKWMETNGFFDRARFGLSRSNVFFESERRDKLARIAGQQCDCFIDDLPEVLEEPLFPRGVMRILYDPAGRHVAKEGIARCANWEEAGDLVWSSS